MLILGLKANIFGLGLGLVTAWPWPLDNVLGLGLTSLALAWSIKALNMNFTSHSATHNCGETFCPLGGHEYESSTNEENPKLIVWTLQRQPTTRVRRSAATASTASSAIH